MLQSPSSSIETKASWAVASAAPNDIAMMNSAAEATSHEALVSIEAEGDCNIKWGTRLANPFYRLH